MSEKKSDTSLQAVRVHLFDVLERLKDGNDPKCDPKDTIDLDRAKVINQTATVIINSAKVEVDAMKILAQGDDVKFMHNLSKTKLLSISD